MQRGSMMLLGITLAVPACESPDYERWDCEQDVECAGTSWVESDLHTCVEEGETSVDERIAEYDENCPEACACRTDCWPMGVTCEQANREPNREDSDPPRTSSSDYGEDSSNDFWLALAIAIALSG